MFLLDEKTAIPKKKQNKKQQSGFPCFTSVQKHIAPVGLSDPKLFSGAVQKLLLVVVLH